MNLRNFDLNLLTIFEAILAERSMTRAAKRLGMTQPAISNALNRLRQQIDDPLFLRTADGMTPTPRAQALAPSIKSALETVRRSLSDDATFNPASANRTFTLALGDYAEQVIAPHLIREVRAQSKNIHFHFLPNAGSSLIKEMREGRVDLVWDGTAVEQNGFISEVVESNKMVCIMAKDHPLAQKDVLSIDDYAQAEHVQLSATSSYTHDTDQQIRRLGIRRKFAVEVPRFLPMMRITAATDLLSTMTEHFARTYQEDFGIVVKELPFDLTRQVYQSWHSSQTNDPGHTWLRELLGPIPRLARAQANKYT
ncbi:MAG: LysR family transcriptional regulator [Parvibaculaceae bacterium]|nr:LysR family transcriptional regulator [Parvibaculaceae bacterium]